MIFILALYPNELLEHLKSSKPPWGRAPIKEADISIDYTSSWGGRLKIPLIPKKSEYQVIGVLTPQFVPKYSESSDAAYDTIEFYGSSAPLQVWKSTGGRKVDLELYFVRELDHKLNDRQAPVKREPTYFLNIIKNRPYLKLPEGKTALIEHVLEFARFLIKPIYLSEKNTTYILPPPLTAVVYTGDAEFQHQIAKNENILIFGVTTNYSYNIDAYFPSGRARSATISISIAETGLTLTNETIKNFATIIKK